jgi:glycosyltransferase involved in cell wall biosynthesis
MNLFLIPSWYPTPTFPNRGVYFRNQAEVMSKLFPEVNIGISTWGQGEPHYLIQAKDHFKNILKIIHKTKYKPYSKKLNENLFEYFAPAYTWTRKFKRGNIDEIVRANLKNLNSYEQRFGKIDLIHAHVAHPGGYVAMEISKQLSIPYLITEHMGPFPFKSYETRNGVLSNFLRLPYQHSLKNIAVSPALKKKMSTYGIATEYVPNSVEEDIFLLKEGEKKNNRFTFFLAAYIVEDKGIKDLIHAVSLLREKKLDIQFRIAGDGPQLEEFRRLAAGLDLLDQIVFLGEIKRSQIVNELQPCDAFILPSHHENMPIAILEALSCGKPVITTKCGGPEFIINKKNGIVVDSANVEQLATAIKYVVENHSAFNPNEIRTLALSEFSSKVVLGRIVKIYEEIILQFKENRSNSKSL